MLCYWRRDLSHLSHRGNRRVVPVFLTLARGMKTAFSVRLRTAGDSNIVGGMEDRFGLSGSTTVPDPGNQPPPSKKERVGNKCSAAAAALGFCAILNRHRRVRVARRQRNTREGEGEVLKEGLLDVSGSPNGARATSETTPPPFLLRGLLVVSISGSVTRKLFPLLVPLLVPLLPRLVFSIHMLVYVYIYAAVAFVR